MSKRSHNRRSESIDTTVFKNYNLSKIEEVLNEEEEQINFRKSSASKETARARHSSLVLPPISRDNNSEQFHFLHNFFSKLASIPSVYSYFKDQSFRSNTITRIRIEDLFTFTPNIQQTLKMISPAVVSSENQLIEKLITQEDTISNPKSIQDVKSRDNTRKLSSKESALGIPLQYLKYQIKLPILDKNSIILFDKFKLVAGAVDNTHRDYKLNWDKYKEFLLYRYPPEMTELMLKWLYHGMSVNFDGWIQDMQKFINYGNEKHFKLAFELYDFNRDRYICTNDAFHAISLDNSQIFDTDIVKIRQAFVMKTNNELSDSLSPKRKNLKKNSKAFMSADEEIKFKVASVHTTKPEALTLDDFFKINFNQGKPQIILDLIKYLTDIDLTEYNSDTEKSQKRKRSEDIVEEMIINSYAREKLLNDPNYPYYHDLENLIIQFPENQSKFIIEKYHEMSFRTSTKSNEISSQSVIEYLQKFFGNNNPYIAASFYHYLSGRKHQNITKASYLNSILILFKVRHI